MRAGAEGASDKETGICEAEPMTISGRFIAVLALREKNVDSTEVVAPP